MCMSTSMNVINDTHYKTMHFKAPLNEQTQYEFVVVLRREAPSRWSGTSDIVPNTASPGPAAGRRWVTLQVKLRASGAPRSSDWKIIIFINNKDHTSQCFHYQMLGKSPRPM